MPRRTAILTTVALAAGALVSAPAIADTDDIDLSNGGYAARITGAGGNDRSGASLALGDVNGDGKADMVVGSQDDDQSGDVYVVFGTGVPADQSLGTLAGKGFRITGPATNAVYSPTVATGDINGDGFDDIIVGLSNLPSGTGAGKTYVVFGGSTPTDVDLSQSLTGKGFVVSGAGGGQFSGCSVASGDVNSDGKDDLIIGASSAPGVVSQTGAAYVVFGQANPTDLTLSSNLGTRGFRVLGVDPGDQTGFSVAAGDVNGDGEADAIVGARSALQGRGRVYVVYGNGSTADRHLSSLGSQGFSITGTSSGDEAGIRVGSADMNGDGKDDVLIGASEPGKAPAYIAFGAATPANVTLNGGDGKTVAITDSANTVASEGGIVATAGDYDADGFEDMLLGMPIGAGGNGVVHVIFGAASFPATLNASALTTGGFSVFGDLFNDALGLGVAGGEDVNGDNGDDLLIGAPFADTGASASGSSYLLLGTPKPLPPGPGPDPTTPTPTPNPTQTAAAQPILTVKARAASKRVKRKGKATLVTSALVAPTGAVTITTKVTPKKATKKVKVKRSGTTLKVRTKKVPKKTRITVTVTSPGATPFARTWRVR